MLRLMIIVIKCTMKNLSLILKYLNKFSKQAKTKRRASSGLRIIRPEDARGVKRRLFVLASFENIFYYEAKVFHRTYIL